jgi:hypothetical protein
MTVGKAIYYLLNNSTDLEAVVGTRIFPEVAEQDSALPFVMYSVISNEPSDTHSGPSLLDVAQVDVIAYNTSYSGCIDMGVYVRAALDRVTGTYNGVNVQSCQYNSEVIDFDEYKRAYVITQSYDVRISRTEFEIAQGTPVTGALLGDLSDVTITDPLEHDALIYDPDTQNWINGIPTDIPVINTTSNTLYAGSPLRATGVQGDKVEAALWSPNQDPKLFMGLAADDIAASETGHCRQIGLVHHLDTSDFEIGDILYPLAATLQFGIKRLGTTPPDHPLARIACAIVLRKHENTGRVFVRTWQPAHAFNDISEVNIATTPDDGQALTYDSATGTWVPGNATPRLLGDISDVQTYDPALLQDRTILRWGATSQTWELVPQTSGLPSAYYLGAYDTEAAANRVTASTASITVERYLTIQGDGEGESISAQSDTPSSGNVIRRKIWYKANSFDTDKVDTWTLIHTFADDTAYSATEATFEALLNAQTYGTPPFTLAQSWEDAPAFTGLLDTYPGAAAAYSLRLLDADYTGSAINVRRASDNAVQDIGFDANGDLDTSALATFCAGTDGYVVRWYDQSGNSNDAVQATTSAQPQIVASGSVLVDANGNPKVVSGSAQGLVATFSSTISQPTTVFTTGLVAASASYLFDGIDATNRQARFTRFAFAGNTIAASNGAGFGLESTLYNSSSSIYRRNGSPFSTGNIGTAGLAGVTLMCRYTIAEGNSELSEFILYSADKSSDFAGIESNINTYYSIY